MEEDYVQVSRENYNKISLLMSLLNEYDLYEELSDEIGDLVAELEDNF